MINYISDSQFGFLQNRSTLQQLLIFFNLLTNQANNKSSVDVIYLDFKKALDSVSHVKLLEKLWAFGITNNVWYWIRAYLTNRVQCVSIHGAVSDLLPVTSGVPQGSILGPLLFLIFVNDLPTNVTPSRVLLFAGDVKITFPISCLDNCNQLQGDITKLLEWSNLWELQFNEKKCCVMHFHFRKVFSITITLVIMCLTVDTTHKDLGIVFLRISCGVLTLS